MRSKPFICLLAIFLSSACQKGGNAPPFLVSDRPKVRKTDSFERSPVRSAPNVDPNEERRALNIWFDSLGIKALATGDFIQVPTLVGDEIIRVKKTFGFLESKDKLGFVFLRPDLSRQEFNSSKPSAGLARPVVYAKADIRAWLVTQKTKYDQLCEDSHHPNILGLDPYLCSQVFVLSRIAELRGYRDLSTWFYNRARDVTVGHSDFAGLTFVERVKNELAAKLVQGIKDQFDDLEVTHADLARQMKFVTDHFPSSPYRAEAQEFVTTLSLMADEERNRSPLKPRVLNIMPSPARAQELVWQLRFQNGRSMTEPGEADVFANYAAGGTPADSLLALGNEAVPALIDGLRDKRYTRIVRQGLPVRRDVIRIRDACLQILNRIAQEKFSGNDNRIRHDNDEEADKVIERVSAWWKQQR